MKQNILGTSTTEYAKIIKKRTVFCVAVVMLAILLNVLFTCLRTDNNHTAMLLLNIFVDITCGAFAIYFVSFYILPQSKLLNLMKKQKEIVHGAVNNVDKQSTMYMGIACYQVMLGDRKLFVPLGTIEMYNKDTLTAQVVSNIVVEVEK